MGIETDLLEVILANMPFNYNCKHLRFVRQWLGDQVTGLRFYLLGFIVKTYLLE